MWEAAEQLRAEYPDLAELVKAGWTADRFTRDGLLALAVGASSSTPAPSPTRASSTNG